MTIRPAVLERLFHLREAGTTIRTELIAGATTFATLSYITFVQPAVLAGAGMDFGAVMAATCVASGFATALMGLAANYPIAVAPAMGHNFFFVYAVTQLGLPWPVALGADFLAGALFILLAAFRFRDWDSALVAAIPKVNAQNRCPAAPTREQESLNIPSGCRLRDTRAALARTAAAGPPASASDPLLRFPSGEAGPAPDYG
jgi:hypothetical protein